MGLWILKWKWCSLTFMGLKYDKKYKSTQDR